MPINIDWDESEPTIIRSHMSGQWTWDEYNEASDIILELARHIEGRVDLITEMASDSVFPKGSAQPHITRLRRQRPDNFKLIVVVRPNAFTKMMIETVNRATKHSDDSIIVQSLEEAFEVIRKDREKDSEE